MATTRNYFQKFPAISYNDYVIRDISLRTKLTQYLIESGIALLPYTIKDGERADNIASFYYEDPYYAWTIYLVNGIIDPYSEWHKDSLTFDDYITSTYGSVEAAQDKILRYEVDWASDTTLLSPAQYDALPQENKKYWEAQFGYEREVINYFRRDLDWTLDNNRLDRIVVVSNSSTTSLGNTFEVGERLYQYNFLNDVAVKSTVISVDSYIDANTVNMPYTNSTFYDINFTSGNSTIFVKSSAKLLPLAEISGTNIPSNTYIEHIVDGTHVKLSAAPTGSPLANSVYSALNPATATLVVEKVDFSDIVFASNGATATPNSFLTYETTGSYMDENNYLVGRKNSSNTVVLYHTRIDTDTQPTSLLSNSQLSINELPYWKSVSAYDDEVNKNQLRKEIYVIDANLVRNLDDTLEELLKNV